MDQLALSHIGSTELPTRVKDYTPEQIRTELVRCHEQRATDSKRRWDKTYKGLVSTDEFWAKRIEVLRTAL